MMTTDNPEVTRLLLAWRQGDEAAPERLMPLVYDELRRLAHRYMKGERDGHTLQTTALVHEAYLRLVDSKQLQLQDRNHFFAVSARLMRRVLVDLARARRSQKRGGGERPVTLNEQIGPASVERIEDMIAMDEALQALESVDSRKSRVIELRFFGGLTEKETAEVLDVSLDTVQRDWKLAKVWLLRELDQEGLDEL